MDIIYVNNICRSCLAHEGEFRSVFIPDATNGLALHFADILMSCTSVQIAVGDGLPEQICTACAAAAIHCYYFKQRCQQSDNILRQQLLEKPQIEVLNFTSQVLSTSSDTQQIDENKKYLPLDTVNIEESSISYKTFDCKNHLEDHFKHRRNEESATETKFVVTTSEQQISNVASIKSEKQPTQKPIFKCHECQRRFKKIAHFNKHFKVHTTVKPYFCKTCEQEFPRREQYVAHLKGHSGVKAHSCNICGKGFNQISNLKDHLRTHNGEKPFLCSVCGKGFNQLGNLRQHTVRHSGIKAHICNMCGNGFASKGELCAHLRKHTGARPFVCSICSNGFTTSSSLTKHKRIHSGEKPYECEVCKMKFSRSGILARHKRTHTGEKPYICKYCTKAFSQSNDLSSHLRIHTGEKPYICDACGQAFRQSSALKAHKKTHVDRLPVNNVERPRDNFVPVFFKDEFHETYEDMKFTHLSQSSFIPKY